MSYWNSDGGNKAERKGSRRREAKQQAGARDEGDAAFIIPPLRKKKTKLYLISRKRGEQTFFLYFLFYSLLNAVHTCHKNSHKLPVRKLFSSSVGSKKVFDCTFSFFILQNGDTFCAYLRGLEAEWCNPQLTFMSISGIFYGLDLSGKVVTTQI